MDKLILERAQNALIARDFSLAARLYKTLLKEESDNVDILRALGNLYEKSNEDEKAIPYYENILTFDPHDVDAMNSLGGIYRRLKQHEKAIEILNRALDEDKKSAMINYTLGFTYKDMGNYDDAIDCFESVVSENPSDVLAYNHLGVIHTAQKNYDKAVMAFRRGLQIDPNHPILHYNLAHAYEAKKSYKDAIACYESALKAKPGWVDGIRDLVKVLLICNQTKRAYDVVQKSIQLYPTNAELIALCGKVCTNRYDFDNAVESYEKADSLKPDDATIKIGKAVAYENMSRFEEAASTAKVAYNIGLQDTSSRKDYVHVMLSAGEFQRAGDEVEKLISESPSDTGVLDSRAQYLICTGDEDGANEVFNQIRELNPNYAHHKLEAARRFNQIGKREKAIQYAEEYIQKQPNNPAAYNLLGKVYEKIGDYEKGIENLKKSIALNTENVYGKAEVSRLTEKYNEHLHDGVVDYINDANRQSQEALLKSIEAEEKEEIVEEPVEEEFDFSQMGDDVAAEPESEENEIEEREVENSVPLLAELSEDEGLSAFNDILSDTDEVLENEKEEKEEEKIEMDPDEKSNPYVPLASPVQEPAEPVAPPEPAPAPEPVAPPPAPKSEPVLPPEPELAESSKPAPSINPEETVGADIEDFMPKYTAEDAMDMLRDDQTPMMDPRLVDKIDDAMQKLEKSVDDVAKMAEEKAQEAMQKAEEAVRKAEEAVKNMPPEQFQMPEEDSFMEPQFAEPEFESPSSYKDPFGEPLNPLPKPAPVEEPVLEDDTEFASVSDLLSGADEIPEPVSEPEPAPKQQTAPASNSSANEAFASAAEFLPNIVKMLENRELADKYKTELELFQKLRSLSEHLPPDQKQDFLSSKTRMLMDYVIAKMSGSPGLMKTVKNLLKSGILDKQIDFEKDEESNLSGNELVCKVVNDLKKLSGNLGDNLLAKALNDEADRLLSKI